MIDYERKILFIEHKSAEQATSLRWRIYVMDNTETTQNETGFTPSANGGGLISGANTEVTLGSYLLQKNATLTVKNSAVFKVTGYEVTEPYSPTKRLNTFNGNFYIEGDGNRNFTSVSLNNYSIYDDIGLGVSYVTSVTGTKVESTGSILMGFRATKGDAVTESVTVQTTGTLAIKLNNATWDESGDLNMGHSDPVSSQNPYGATGDGQFLSSLHLDLSNGSLMDVGKNVLLGADTKAGNLEQAAEKYITIDTNSTLRYGGKLDIALTEDTNTTGGTRPAIIITADLKDATGVLVWIDGTKASGKVCENGYQISPNRNSNVDLTINAATGNAEATIGTSISLSIANYAGWTIKYDGKSIYAYQEGNYGSYMAVDTAWKGYSDGTLVTDSAGNGYIFGENAFATLEEAAANASGSSVNLRNYTISEDTVADVVLSVDSLLIDSDEDMLKLDILAGKTIRVENLTISSNLTITGDGIIRLDATDTVAVAGGVTLTLTAAQMQEFFKLENTDKVKDTQFVITGEYSKADLESFNEFTANGWKVDYSGGIYANVVVIEDFKADLTIYNKNPDGITRLIGTSGNDKIALAKNGSVVYSPVYLSYDIDLLGGSNTFNVGSGRHVQLNQTGDYVNLKGANLQNITTLNVANGTADYFTILHLGEGRLETSGKTSSVTVGNLAQFTAMGGITKNPLGGSNKITVGTNSTFSTGVIDSIASLTLKNNTGVKNETGDNTTVFNSGNLTGVNANSTVNFGNNNKVAVDGVIDLGGGKNTLTIGANTVFESGSVSNIATLTVSAGTMLKLPSGSKPQQFTLVNIGGGINAPGTANKLSIGAYAKMAVQGSLLNTAETGTTITVGSNSTFKTGYRLNTADGTFTKEETAANIIGLAGLTLSAGKDYKADGAAAALTPGRTVMEITGTVTGTSANNTIKADNNTTLTIAGDLDLLSGSNSLTLGQNAEVSVLNLKNTQKVTLGKFSALTINGSLLTTIDGILNTISAGANSTLTVAGNAESVNSLKIANGASADGVQGYTNVSIGTKDKYTGENYTGCLTGTEKNDTVSVGNFANLTTGTVILGTGKDTVSIGTNSSLTVNGNLFFDEGESSTDNPAKIKDSLTMADGSTLTVTGNIYGLETFTWKGNITINASTEAIAALKAVNSAITSGSVKLNDLGSAKPGVVPTVNPAIFSLTKAGNKLTENTEMDYPEPNPGVAWDAVTLVQGSMAADTITVGKDAILELHYDVDLAGGTNKITVAAGGGIFLKDGYDGQNISHVSSLNVANGTYGAPAGVDLGTGSMKMASGNAVITMGDFTVFTAEGGILKNTQEADAEQAENGSTKITIGTNSTFTAGRIDNLAGLTLKNNTGVADTDENEVVTATNTTVFVSGNLTGLNSNDTLNFGNNNKVTTGDIDLLGGKNTLTIGSNTVFESGKVSGAGTLTIGAGTTVSKTVITDDYWYIAKPQMFTVVNILGDIAAPSTANKLTIGAYAETAVQGSLLSTAETGTAVSVGSNSQFRVGYTRDYKTDKDGNREYLDTYTASESGSMTGISGLTLAAGKAYKVKDTADWEEEAVQARTLVEVKGDLTGTTANNTITLGNYSDLLVHGKIDLLGGTNSISIGKAAKLEIGMLGSNSLENVQKVTIAAGAMGEEGQLIVAGQMKAAAGTCSVTAGNYSKVSLQQLIASEMGSTIAVSVGGNAEFSVNGVMESISSLKVANGLTYADADGVKVQGRSVVSVTDSITGTVKNDTVSIGNYAVFTSGNIDLGMEAKSKDTFTAGANSQVSIGALTGTSAVTVNAGTTWKYTEEVIDNLNYVTLKTYTIQGITDVTINGDYTPQNDIATTFNIKNFAQVRLTGNFGTSSETAEIQLKEAVALSGQDYDVFLPVKEYNKLFIYTQESATVTVGANSSFIIEGNSVSGINKLTLANGSGKYYYINEKLEERLGVTVFQTSAEISGTEKSDTISIGSNAKFSSGKIDLGSEKNTFSVGSNSIVKIDGNLAGATSVTVNGGTAYTYLGTDKNGKSKNYQIQNFTTMTIDGDYTPWEALTLSVKFPPVDTIMPFSSSQTAQFVKSIGGAVATTFNIKSFAMVNITGNFGDTEVTETIDVGANVTVGANSVLTIGGGMTGINKLTISNGSGKTYYGDVSQVPYWKVIESDTGTEESIPGDGTEGDDAGTTEPEKEWIEPELPVGITEFSAGGNIWGTAKNDTVNVGKFAAFESGDILLGDGNDAVSIGTDTVFRSGSIDFGGGKGNKFTVADSKTADGGSRVYIGGDIDLSKNGEKDTATIGANSYFRLDGTLKTDAADAVTVKNGATVIGYKSEIEKNAALKDYINSNPAKFIDIDDYMIQCTDNTQGDAVKWLAGDSDTKDCALGYFDTADYVDITGKIAGGGILSIDTTNRGSMDVTLWHSTDGTSWSGYSVADWMIDLGDLSNTGSWLVGVELKDANKDDMSLFTYKLTLGQ